MVAVFLFPAHGIVSPTHAAETKKPTYVFATGKVLKVYETKEGEAFFRAYVVIWKDHQIVVSDNLVKSNYKEGEEMKFIVMTMQNPIAGTKPDILAFQALPVTAKTGNLQ
jgi:hypothetical protein